MKKTKANEELQSRREFFKKAAKGALPILGVMVLANVPGLVNAAETPSMGCDYTCAASCQRGCNSGCQGTCKTSCSGGCRGGYTNLK